MRGRRGGGRFGAWFGGHGEGRHEGGPWGFRQRFFESGEVRLALLSLLEDGPRHGYELMKELESRSGGMYKASAGTVYPNLQLLEDEGLIRAEVPEDGKRVYAITDEGRAELNRNRETIGRIWSRADDWGGWSDAMSPNAMELWGPGKRLLRAAFTAVARGDDARVEKVRRVLYEAAEKIEKL
jgi:DNA-binding PadR family transcriptional regulator